MKSTNVELLNKIQRELKVPKSQFNAFAKYNYRNCEDILEAVKPLLGEGTLTLSDEIVQLGERFYVKATATLHEPAVLKEGGDPKVVFFQPTSVTAYAREALDKKGMDEAQITGAASSYARKYALCGLFAIDDGEDADKEDNSKPVPVEKKETAKPAWKRPIKSTDQLLKEKKAAIKDLLEMRAQADPNNLFDELKTKEDFEEACMQYTGIELKDENADEILKELLK